MGERSEHFRLVGMNLSGTADANPALAASRAGGFGILNLEFASSHATTQAFEKLTQFGTDNLGLRLNCLENFPKSLPPVITTVILAHGTKKKAEHFQTAGLLVWAEVTSLKQAISASKWADGIVAKGHEAGGYIGEETSFVLLQQIVETQNLASSLGRPLPVYAHGGIGIHTISAAIVAGASGAIFDSQLALMRGVAIPDSIKQAVSRFDGSETTQIGNFRFHARPHNPSQKALQDTVVRLKPTAKKLIHKILSETVGWTADTLIPIGQDIAFAQSLAQKYQTIGRFFNAVGTSLAVSPHALAADNPLAVSHNTTYPIVQGPMTRVSDTAPFAKAVADGGGLPFLALSLMREPEVDTLMGETADLLAEQPWGVGILGFVPHELRQEQLAIVRKYKPKFAIIAGGRPDQAAELEEDGIATYLHVPSPGLLQNFVKNGARRFIFEGKECGGHIGPRSSFVLWETMVESLLNEKIRDFDALHILFAGGIHDGVSAAMVAALSAPLAERGAKIGVLMGTSYLFTDEAVDAGAILPTFQKQAVSAKHTVTVESGAGHAIRCVENKFTQEFEDKKRELLRTGKSATEVREELDGMNIGRLRIASKGVDRHPDYKKKPDAPKFIELSATKQKEQGMYMIGQVAAMRHETVSIEALHKSVSEGSQEILERFSVVPADPRKADTKPMTIAIIGMETVLPKAQTKQHYWENIVNGVYAISEIPKNRWDTDLYFDPDRQAKDRIYSRWGGFIDDIAFDPLEFGMPPRSLKSIDPMQLLALKTAKLALQDAGYDGADRGSADHANTGVILGCSGGLGDVGSYYLLRTLIPQLVGKETADSLMAQAEFLPEWTEDSFAGLLPNVAAGRIANRLDCGGVNYVVDAACGSSLAAVHLACKELESHNTDMMIVGGVDTIQSPFGFMCFSQTQALSPEGKPKVFDENSDGIAISEGAVMLVLKRLEDAERDGDEIYAVIRGASGSSDGKALGMTAPRPEGQILALERAYGKAGYSAKTVGLFEAHGTGTAVGDRTEASSLGRYLAGEGADVNAYPVGSVKSMIGHTKAAAGVAGLTKIALALHHKILPPTLNVSTPNPKANFNSGPLFVNGEARPWLHTNEHPRRAGVSAFGFGGTNFHVTIEAYENDYAPTPTAPVQTWSHEILAFSGENSEIVASLREVGREIEENGTLKLKDLAFKLWQEFDHEGAEKAVIVACEREELLAQIDEATRVVEAKTAVLKPTDGILYAPEKVEGRVAFLFPGQGAQYPNMLRELAILFDEVREGFELGQSVLNGWFDKKLGDYIFPPTAFDKEAREAQKKEITQTNVAQPSIGSAELALYSLLQNLNIRPDMTAGHSYGEYMALYAGGALSAEDMLVLSAARGKCMIDAAEGDLGTMAAVSADETAVVGALDGMDGVWIANLNAPTQTIISGSEAGIESAVSKLSERGMRATKINVAAAFHSPLVAPAQESFADYLAKADFSAPEIPVYANGTGQVHTGDLAKTMGAHIAQPVRWIEEIEAMYADGARIFVECGPKTILSGLTRKILGKRDYLAVGLDKKDAGLGALLTGIGQLLVAGVEVDLGRLFVGRSTEDGVRSTEPSPTTWLVNGGRVKPMGAEEVVGKPVSISAPQHFSQSASQPSPVVRQPVSRPPSAVELNAQLMNQFLTDARDVMVTALGTKNGEKVNVSEKVITEKNVSEVHQAVNRLVEPPTGRPPANEAHLPPTVESVGRSLMVLEAVDLEKKGDWGSVAVSGDDGVLVADVKKAIKEAGGAIDEDATTVLHLVSGKEATDFEEIYTLFERLKKTDGIEEFVVGVSAETPLSYPLAGLTRTAHQELSTTVRLLKTDDFTPSAIIQSSNHLLSSPHTELIQKEGKTYTRKQISQPLAQTKQTVSITKDDVILVTGGARGITAKVAIELAKTAQPTLILVGRSVLDSEPESALTQHLIDEKAIKNAIIASLREESEIFTLSDVDKRFKKLKKQREMRENIALMQAYGATVHYHSADVSDADALQAVLETIGSNPTAVIHGAGTIDDKKIVDKSLESFDQVFKVKADSAENLLSLLSPANLKFIVFFSSVSGIHGNIGQADYAAANAHLNGLATTINNAGIRALSAAWGPWSGAGMVSPALANEFSKRGIPLINPDAGCAALLAEIQYGTDPVIIFADGEWGATPTLPLLTEATVSDNTISRTFSLDTDPYLNHHRLDGKPVLPMAVATEWIIEAVSHLTQKTVTQITDLRVLAGIKFTDDRPLTIDLSTADTSDPYQKIVTISIGDRTCYRATAHLANAPLETSGRLPALNLAPLSESISDAYEKWLFHGPLFQGIETADLVGDDGIMLTINQLPANASIPSASDGWVFDPIRFDCALQGALIWARKTLDATPVPLGFQNLTLYGRPPAGQIRAYLKMDRSKPNAVGMDITFASQDGTIFAQITGAHGQLSGAFNRLGGHEIYQPVRVA